jgi:DNA-binding NtrC family response regulator
LRERAGDLPLLVEHFVRKLSERLNRPTNLTPGEVMAALKAHDWPGNIRELRNVIELAMVLLPGPVLRPAPTELKHMTRQASATASLTLADAERECIPEVLKQTDWLIGGQHGAAIRLGSPRTALVYKMQSWELRVATRSRHGLLGKMRPCWRAPHLQTRRKQTLSMPRPTSKKRAAGNSFGGLTPGCLARRRKLRER